MLMYSLLFLAMPELLQIWAYVYVRKYTPLHRPTVRVKSQNQKSRISLQLIEIR